MLSLDCFRFLANRGIPIAGIGSFIRLSLVISLRNWSFRLQTSRSIIISTGFAFIAFLRAVLTIYASRGGASRDSGSSFWMQIPGRCTLAFRDRIDISPGGEGNFKLD